jgi:sugar phosphate isomerase/epimerase
VRDADVEAGVAIEHPAIDETGDGERLLVEESERQVEVERADSRVAQRPVDTGRCRVDEHRDVEVGGGLPQLVESGVVEGRSEIGADVGTDETEITDGSSQFGRCGVDVLHGELCRSGEPVGVGVDHRRHGVVVPAAVVGRHARFHMMEVGDGIRRQHLQFDPETVVQFQPSIDVHERTLAVADTTQHVITRPEPRGAVGVLTEFGSVVACTAERTLEHDMCMYVDHRCVSLPVIDASDTSDTGPELLLAAGSMLDIGPAECLRAAAAAGFDGVGLRISAEHSLDPAGVRRVRRALSDEGLVLWDVEVHRIGPGPGGLDVPEALLERAAALGARNLLVVSDHPDIGATLDALVAISDAGREFGVDIALEYMAWTTPSDPVTAGEIAAAARCRVVVDVLHHVRVGASAGDVTVLAESGVLAWVQVCDAPVAAPVGGVAALVDEARHRRSPPGSGHLPLHGLLAGVPRSYRWSVEVQSDELRTGIPDPVERAVLLAGSARQLAHNVYEVPSSER